MKILIDDFSTTNEHLWKYRYIWERETIINNELQWYTDPIADPIEHARTLKNNIITAQPSTPRIYNLTQQAYMSALITTSKKLAFKYGTMELIADIPMGAGLWPAWWFLVEAEKWPTPLKILPELDGMESIGDNVVHGGVHYHTRRLDPTSKTSKSGKTKGLKIGFNKFNVVWNENTITWLLNDNEYFSVETPDDLQDNMHMLLNFAVGGNWPGKPQPDSTPAQFKLDSVTIDTPNMLYPVPPGVKLLDSGPTVPPPLGPQDKHIQMMLNLVKTGVWVHNNKQHWHTIARNYLVGDRLPDGLNLTFDPTNFDADHAWSGILLIIAHAVQNNVPAPTQIQTLLSRVDQMEVTIKDLQGFYAMANTDRPIAT